MFLPVTVAWALIAWAGVLLVEGGRKKPTPSVFTVPAFSIGRFDAAVFEDYEVAALDAMWEMPAIEGVEDL